MLASLPGCPAIICGDEIGKPNDYGYMKEQTRLKQERFANHVIVDDVRDITVVTPPMKKLARFSPKKSTKPLTTIFNARIQYLPRTIPQLFQHTNKIYFHLS